MREVERYELFETSIFGHGLEEASMHMTDAGHATFLVCRNTNCIFACQNDLSTSCHETLDMPHICSLSSRRGFGRWGRVLRSCTHSTRHRAYWLLSIFALTVLMLCRYRDGCQLRGYLGHCSSFH